MILSTLVSPYAMFAPSYSLFSDPYDVTRATMPSWYHLAESHRRQHDIQRRRLLALQKTMKDAWRLREHAASHWTKNEDRATHWIANDDHAELDLHLQGVADGSLSAELSSDGRSIKLSGKSKACDCQQGDVLAKIALPHAVVSPDDLELVQQGESILKIRTAVKRAEKPPLELKILRQSPAPEEQVAPPRDAKQEEKELNDKFKVTSSPKLDDVVAEVSAVHKAKAALKGLVAETEETQGKQVAPDTEASDAISTGNEAITKAITDEAEANVVETVVPTDADSANK